MLVTGVGAIRNLRYSSERRRREITIGVAAFGGLDEAP
jgi:hypothetical protein